MKPNELFVVYNTEQNRILHVYPEEFMADNKAAWYWNDPKAPFSGSKPNNQKIEVRTLEEALYDMCEDAFYHGNKKPVSSNDLT